jgi:hypothetical protein
MIFLEFSSKVLLADNLLNKVLSSLVEAPPRTTLGPLFDRNSLRTTGKHIEFLKRVVRPTKTVGSPVCLLPSID